MTSAALTGPTYLLGLSHEPGRGFVAVLERDGHSYVVEHLHGFNGETEFGERERIVSLTDWDGDTFQVVDARHR